MIKSYFKIAWRNLWRHKRMTLINVVGLSIGMAATILIVLWVQNERSFDNYQPSANDLFRIKTKLAISPKENWLWESVPYVLGEHAAKEIPEVENLTRIQSDRDNDLTVYYKGNFIAEKNAAHVDDQWFNMFHYDFIEGSANEFNKNPYSVILTQSAAKKYFGNVEAIGAVLRIDTNNYQVQGIVKDNPANSSFQFNLLIPIAAKFTNAGAKADELNWGNYGYVTFVKLRPGADKNKVGAKLTSILRHDRKDDNGQASFSLINLKNMHFENDVMNSAFQHGNRTIVNVFIALAVLLLITACINYVNLTTARASIRSKEVSIRKIVGAGRLNLFGQFMSESFMISLIAVLLSLALVQACIPSYREFTGKQFPDPVSSVLVWQIVGFTLLVSFILNGLYPATLLSSFSPLNVFRGRSVLSFKDSGLRKTLVVIQFTISVVLIIGTMVIYRQLNYVQHVDLGYNKAHVFTVNVPWKALGKNPFKDGPVKLQAIKREIKQQSSVAEVSLAQGQLVDFNNQSSGNFDWDGRPKSFEPSFAPLEADEDFQHMMGIQIKEGRWFNGSQADKHNVLLNETALKLINLKGDPIGQRFVHQGDTGIIIGLVKDFHYRSLHDKIGPMVVANRGFTGTIYIKTLPGNTSKAVAAAQKIMTKFAPGQPFEYHFLDDTYDNLYHSEQQSSLLITVFAAIAIIVSALGLLGLAAFAAEQKVKEIGIRKVLGASVQHIVRLLSADFLKMVVIASIIAFPIAWWAMSKWLQDFAYKIELSWWIFITAGLIALLIALITVSAQAIKAAVANPVKSLRSE